jgi:hypothetical protein
MDLCCTACMIRYRQGSYYIMDYVNKHKEKHPNWKLVSKNRKQWMKKPKFTMKTTKALYIDYRYTSIKW